MPFVLYNLPDVAAAKEKWLVPGYLSNAFNGARQNVEISNTSHFLVRPYYDLHTILLL